MKKLFYVLILTFLISTLQSQTTSAFWVSIKDADVKPLGERTIIPQKYTISHLTDNSFRTLLFSSPNEKKVELKNSQTIVELPLPNGTIQKFRVVESPIMAPELAAKFPNIKTFNVQGVDDPSVFGKLDWNDFGFHAMIRKTSGDFYIDPYCRNNQSDYITYNTADFKKDPSKIVPESPVVITKKEKKKENFTKSEEKNLRTMICSGADLRTYRLAVACTGEYAMAATGLPTPSVSQILSCVVTSVNRVDGVYESEFAVKLSLVANETSILYADTATDPFTGNNNSGILLGESQTEIDNTIGDANYDMGHTFSTGGGGQAYLGCIFNSGTKASAITGSYYPVGDPYDIDYVAHEMGHQFNGNHSFTAVTGSCSGNQNASTEMEPGSGVEIMSYAGICGINDLAQHSIPYFHSVTFDEVMDFTTNGGGSNCPVITATGNHPPVVTGSTTHTIPNATPFILTGSATDPDNDVLTYQWEEYDLGNDNDWNSGAPPYFRSYTPTASPSRMFPKLEVVLSGHHTDTIGEYLPSTAQTLNFRLIARDNKVGGGGVCYAASQVILASSGPFAVTSPNTAGISWASGSSQTVTWNVNGSNTAAVSCSNVNILISVDGGLTFTTLLANTPNDGTQLVSVPTVTVTETTCRIKVESVGNIFFDICDYDFTITALSSNISALAGSNSVTIKLMPNPFTNEIQISISGLDKKEKTNLFVFDRIGKLVMTDVFMGKDELDQKYDLSFLSKGVYVIELSNTKQKSRTHLIKE